jgi:hypothetical protein
MGLSAEVVELAAVSVMASLNPLRGIKTPMVPLRLKDAIGTDAAADLSQYIKGLVSQSSRTALMLTLPVDVKHASRFEALAPPVWLTADNATYRRQWMVPVELHTAENARFCVSFATDVALAVDARMASPLPGLGDQGVDELA